MYYVRVSRVLAQRGQEQRVRHLFSDLSQFFARQDGCLAHFLLASSTDPRMFLRIGIWKDKAHADHAAMQDKGMALRAEIMVWAESHPEEEAYDLAWAAGSLPQMVAPQAA